MKQLPRSFFARDALTVARELLGKRIKKGVCEGIIVECEAYAGDAASHAVKKPVQGRWMRETYGHWYVYFTYGMHWCVNVTCDKGGVGGVLIRAVEPTAGIAQMKRRRGTDDALRLTKGPACVTQAFGIDKTANGLLLSKEFGIFDAPRIPDEEVVAAPRVGIAQAQELPWRFYIKDNPYVSKVAKVKNA